MSFYGNITNTSRTQFQFDKTFPNRVTMDKNASTDGVYVGRFVLVEYDEFLAADWSTTAFLGTDNYFYTSNPNNVETAAAKEALLLSAKREGENNIVKGKYIRVPGKKLDSNNKEIIYNLKDPGKTEDVLYEITGLKDYITVTESIIKIPTVKIVSEFNNSAYNENYNIDIKAYGPGRGYDSTVWQKVYADKNEKYVMIAELNSVVPTFDTSVDAPSMSPIPPHFDTDSTNVYYKIHMQPNWGLRIKSAAQNIYAKPINSAGETIIGDDVRLSPVNNTNIPSDETTLWTKAGYSDGKTKDYIYTIDSKLEDNSMVRGSWRVSSGTPKEDNYVPAAIYYNKKGFTPEKINYSRADVVDKISLEATGLSGQEYNSHDVPGEKIPQTDTQELSIILPSIGNTIAKVWDTIYGDEDINGGLDRNMDVNWKDASIIDDGEGLRMIKPMEGGIGYYPEETTTIAGAINSVNRLMGMVIEKHPDAQNPNSLTKSELNGLNRDFIHYFPAVNKYYYVRSVWDWNEFDEPSIQKAEYTVVTPTLQDFNAADEAGKPLHLYYYAERSTTKPSYILESNYRREKVYYQDITFAGTPLEFSGEFTPLKFFHKQDSYLVEYVDKDGNLQKAETIRYFTSLDKTFNNTKNYFNIIPKMLGDNVRLWREGAYYKAAFALDEAPEPSKLAQGLYFLKNAETGHYDKCPKDSIFNTDNDYYTASSFTPAPNVVEPGAQYYSFNIEQNGDYIYVEKVDYILDKTVNASNFNQRTYYVLENGIYTIANSFKAGTNYYYKESRWELQESTPSVTADNVNEIVMLEMVENKYYSYNPVGKDGYPTYTLIQRPLVQSLALNICTIEAPEVTNFYVPDAYYYKITDKLHPFYGSYVIDKNNKMTEGREYYLNVNVTETQDFLCYEPDRYYYDVNQGTGKEAIYVMDHKDTFTTGRVYYNKYTLYVREDTTGKFSPGYEWNYEAPWNPEEIKLCQKVEKTELRELKGLAQHYNTLYSLIIRLNSLLESDDKLTREFNTAQGLINRLRDIILKFEKLTPNQITITNKWGQITTGELTGDTWVKTSVVHPNVKVNHKTVSLTNTSYSPADAVFTSYGEGGSIKLPSLTADGAGHITALTAAAKTITIPTLSLGIVNEGNVIANITFDGKNTFTKTKSMLGDLAIGASYKKATTSSAINGNETLNIALGKLEYKVDIEPTNRDTAITNAINALDVTAVTSGQGEVIGSISQTNGKISASKKTLVEADIPSLSANKITSGTLDVARIPNLNMSKITNGNLVGSRVVLTGYTPLANTAADPGVVVATDTINQAIQKLQYQINRMMGGV